MNSYQPHHPDHDPNPTPNHSPRPPRPPSDPLPSDRAGCSARAHATGDMDGRRTARQRPADRRLSGEEQKMKTLLFAAAIAVSALVIAIPALALVINTVARVGQLLGMP